jgi:hypothetical protein
MGGSDQRFTERISPMPDQSAKLASAADRLHLAITERRRLLWLGMVYGYTPSATWGQIEDRLDFLKKLIRRGTHEATGNAPIESTKHGLDPTLGTTIGDLTLPGDGFDFGREDPGSLKDDLIKQFLDRANGGGVKIGTGEAAGKPNEAGKSVKNTAEKLIKEADNEIKRLNSENESLRSLIDAYDKAGGDPGLLNMLRTLAEALVKLEDARNQNKQLKDIIKSWINWKTPHPEVIEGNWQPSHPLGWPAWIPVLKPPGGRGPLWDPTRVEGTGGSNVKKQRGQAVDPSPDDQRFEAELRRSVVYVYEGVIDPILLSSRRSQLPH